MSWRDQLQPAAFRGVSFLVESADAEFGRRAFSVEYPFREEAFVDDMGRKLRRYSFEAFLLGSEENDLFAQRGALISALEASGPATLIHPRLGALRVQAGNCRWRSNAGSNKETFSLEFIEALDSALPHVANDTLDAIVVTAGAVNDAQTSWFDRALDLQQRADFVIDSAIAEINRGMTGVREFARRGQSISDSISDFVRTADDAIDSVADLVNTPRTLAASIAGIVNTALTLDSRVSRIMSGYRAIGALWGDVDPIPQTTPSRRAQASNRAAIAQQFSLSATVAAAQLVSTAARAIGVTSNAQSPFDSADEAYAVRDELVAALDAIALTADDELFVAIGALQTALISHIEAHGNTLPRITRVTLNNTLPMLVIAHNLTGGIDIEADLVARNRIKHPTFVPAGSELEVLYG